MRRRGGTAVYPRVCGGTPAGVFLPANCPGLSPRVRGNRPPSASTYRHGRSIPACAGEPAVARRRLCPRKVYPRVCGGTGPRRAADDAVIGLSPRVRGNHQRPRCHRPHSGSIPACAGEPRCAPSPPRITPVYPRVCGGTTDGGSPDGALDGLSPRVRGNLAAPPTTCAIARSIPACAGEPRSTTDHLRNSTVYPRVCGGTLNIASPPSVQPGLSPRVRGNPPATTYRNLCRGSIPACAGEPPHANADADD